MTTRRGRSGSVSNCDPAPLLAAMGDLYREVCRINLQLPIRSPTRAALKTLSDQMKEIATVLTGDDRYFTGRNTTPPPGSFDWGG